MKNLKLLSFILLSVFIFLGCEKKDITHPIVGHTYMGGNTNNGISFYFHENNTCYMKIYKSGSATSNNNLTYSISGDNVDISCDNSDYWKESSRGKILYHLVYNSSNDILTCDGDTFKRIE